MLIGYDDYNDAPYAIERAETLHGGIIKDIATELSAELDVKYIICQTPRKRIERNL
ncbi:MAG: hypothetical protein GY928_08880 [Colwellia sp.]|nr:hypothetical protein [Colwellia sp.]